jgi:hypothetical protein
MLMMVPSGMYALYFAQAMSAPVAGQMTDGTINSE